MIARNLAEPKCGAFIPVFSPFQVLCVGEKKKLVVLAKLWTRILAAPLETTDEALWHQFVSERDREVLAVLFDRYLALVYGVCLKYLKEREEAKDAAMEVFEKLVHHTSEKKIENFRTWLYVVTKNHCLMKLRSKKSVLEKTTQVFMEYLEYVHPLDEDATDPSPALYSCLEKLGDEQKDCVVLFYFEKKSYQEIAAEKSLDLKEVKSHIQNGKRNLRICIEKRNG